MYRDYPLLIFSHPGLKLAVVLILIWTVVWKGIALWKSAQSGHKAWFVVLFLLNTVGILDIVYIIWFSKRRG